VSGSNQQAEDHGTPESAAEDTALVQPNIAGDPSHGNNTKELDLEALKVVHTAYSDGLALGHSLTGIDAT